MVSDDNTEYRHIVMRKTVLQIFGIVGWNFLCFMGFTGWLLLLILILLYRIPEVSSWISVLTVFLWFSTRIGSRLEDFL